MINLSEIFRSIQGEGSCTGRPSVFIRVSGCNLRCKWKNSDGTVTLCDTPYTSHAPERKLVPVEEVIERIRAGIMPGDHLVITGGEPTLYVKQIERIVEAFCLEHVITIETNGSNPVAIEGVVLWSVSPKLQSAGNNKTLEQLAKDIRDLRDLNPRAMFQVKMVVSDEVDLLNIDRLAGLLSGVRYTMMLMPQGITAEQIDKRLPMIAEHALKRGYVISDRLHVRIWKGIRGV